MVDRSAHHDAVNARASNASRDDSSLALVLRTLDAIAETRTVWPHGLFHPGGPHRRLKGEQYPISIGEDECRTFGKLIRGLRPGHCFIIGNAFGLSSAYIAHVMQQHGGQSVVTLDDQSEGNGQRCAAIAQELAERLELGSLLVNKKGRSPEHTREAAGDRSYDLIFIDGLHRHPQVTRDFEGVQPIADERSVVVWHDGWIPGIPESVETAKQQGMHCLWLPTSCEMILGTRDPQMFARLQELFPEGEIEHRHPNYFIGYLRYLQTYWSIRFERMSE
jgi:predicted O-methyltransferase YrrM